MDNLKRGIIEESRGTINSATIVEFIKIEKINKPKQAK